MDELLRRVQAWIAADPDPSTRAELSALIEAGELDELAERMDGVLAFGTAGLRGAVQAGSNRMNRASVIRATRGLADFLIERHAGIPTGPVVVGRDARLSSRRFMTDTVAVLAAAGLEVRFWAEEVPTPLVAHAVKAANGCAGVMITASHNPPQDNGYKVYDANAAQIIPPVDSSIAAAIDRVGAAVDVPRIRDALGRRRPPGSGQSDNRYWWTTAGISPAFVSRRPVIRDCGSYTPRCTGSAGGTCAMFCSKPVTRISTRYPNRWSPMGVSRPSHFPIPRNRGPWTCR